MHVRKQKTKTELPVEKMPSLSTKQEPVVANDPTEFSKSMIVMMEKKIRNLEKRKVVTGKAYFIMIISLTKD